MSDSGWLLGSIFLVVSAMMNYYGAILLYEVKVECDGSIGDIAAKTIGNYGRLLLEISLISTQIGICCNALTYLIETFLSISQNALNIN